MTTVGAITILTPSADRKAEAVDNFKKLATVLEGNPECLAYQVFESGDDLVVIQKFKSQQAFETHQEKVRNSEAVKKAAELVTTPPIFKVFSEGSVAGFLRH